MKEQSLFTKMDDFTLVEIYGYWLTEIKYRGMIITNNVFGELGKYLSIKYYKETSRLPRLQASPTGSQNINEIICFS